MNRRRRTIYIWTRANLRQRCERASSPIAKRPDFVMQTPLRGHANVTHASSRRDLPSLQDTQTHAHLRASFVHDVCASSLSERYARVAEIEGFPEVARVFHELAEAQAFQAQGHLDLLARAGDPLSGCPIGDTARNLRSSLTAYQGELSERLADMIAAARAEGFPDVASWFETLRSVRRAQCERLSALVSEG